MKPNVPNLLSQYITANEMPCDNTHL